MTITFVGPRVLSDPSEDIFRLASSVYHESTLLPVATLSGWYRRNPEIFWLVRDKERLIAYLSMLPISEDAFRFTLEPSFDEHLLTADTIEPYTAEGNYRGFISSIVVHPDYRGGRVSRPLRTFFLNTLINWWANRRRIIGLSAEALNDHGAAMMSSLGLHVNVRSEHGSLLMVNNCSESTLTQCRDGLLGRMHSV
jgi:GNAT superfamily N-acetyltransferase